MIGAVIGGDGDVQVGACESGAPDGTPAGPGSIIDGNWTRCAWANVAANRQPMATTPRNEQAVNSVNDFKLGTEW